MKKAIMASALAATLFGGIAFAEEVDVSAEQQDLSTQQDTTIQADEDSINVETETSTEPDAFGGSGTEGTDVNVNTQPAYASPVVVEEEKETADMRGLTVMLGGGVEGYSGTLAPQINPGFGWGVSAAIKPSKVLGLEFAYSGAANEVSGADINGADIVRNGGQIAATIGLGAAPVQPYILGGVGLHHYNVRNDGAGVADDTNGAIPLGAGLRTHVGNFTADLRGTYNLMFNQDFAPGAEEMELLGLDTTRGGRYQGLLQIGTTF